MKYTVIATKQYKKALKKYRMAGNFDISKLEKIIDIIVLEKQIPRKYKDHKLSGILAGLRELHVTPDLLLI